VTTQTKITAQDVVEALRRHFPPNRFAFFEQVRNETWATRTADVVVMNMWPSQGQALHGIEIKTSRTDWLQETKQPEKAETFARFCDYWWVVVSDPDIIHVGELPDGWGQLSICRGKVRVTHQAPKLMPQPLTRVFIAELIRNLAKDISIEPKLKVAEAKGFDRGKEALKSQANLWEGRYQDLLKQVYEFQQASKVEIGSWNGWGRSSTKIGTAVRMVLDGEETVVSVQHRLDNLRREAMRIVETIDASSSYLETSSNAP
jgi:hypothetical protein